MLKVGWFYRLIVCTHSVATNSKYACCMCYSKGLENIFVSYLLVNLVKVRMSEVLAPCTGVVRKLLSEITYTHTRFFLCPSCA